MDKVGFVLFLLGAGGVAEAYGNGKQLTIGLLMLISGALLIGIGDLHNDIKKAKRIDDYSANRLERLFFLR